MKFKRKGILALDALIGTILSVIALFFIFQVFVSAFLQTPSNLKIAEGNAKSIVEFVNFNLNKDLDYNNFENCFSVLKLNFLENYQYKEDNQKNNYFYILNNKGVHIVKNSDIPEDNDAKKSFFKNYLNKIPKKDFRFEKQVNLKLDNTDEGLFATFDIMFVTIGNSDDNLDLNLFSGVYVLIPKFNSENTYLIEGYDNEDKEFKGNSLVLKHNNGNLNLFFSKSLFSEILVKKNLCSKFNLNSNDKLAYYNQNLEKIDYFNYNINFYCGDKKSNFIINSKIKWENNKGYCEDTDNKYNLCDGFDEGLSYLKFIELIKDNCFNVDKTKNLNFGILNLNQLKGSEIIKNKIEKIPFESVFNILNSENTNTARNMIYDFDKKEDNLFTFDKDINGCNDNNCQNIYYNNGKAYFYVKDLELKNEHVSKINYYNFNELSLRKKQSSYRVSASESKQRDDLYFNSQRYLNCDNIENDRDQVKDYEMTLPCYHKLKLKNKKGFLGFGADENLFYVLDININTKDKYTIVLSQAQFERISYI